MFTLENLQAIPNALAKHYAAFKVSEKLLLTGHSHQAWPDCARQGQEHAWQDAAWHVDEKWERAFVKAEAVRKGFARLLDDEHGAMTLAGSTHDLLVRFLSALPLSKRPRLVTTDGEYHTIRRQLDRLAEERIEVVRVPAHPAATAGERLAEAVNERTAAALISSVFFQTGQIAGGLAAAMEACQRQGAELLVDLYHTLNAVPFSVRQLGLTRAYLMGGGYKYCQLGEGNCFLRFPEDCTLRPVVTGWFSEFDTLAETGSRNETGTRNPVPYGRGASRFAGSTYDPISHYRADEVFKFFEAHELSPEFLRKVSQYQVGLLMERFDALDADPALITRDRSVTLQGLGGFLALRSPRAGELCENLRRGGVLSDFRGTWLRLGPAPYMNDEQLRAAMGILAYAVKSLTG